MAQGSIGRLYIEMIDVDVSGTVGDNDDSGGVNDAGLKAAVDLWKRYDKDLENWKGLAKLPKDQLYHAMLPRISFGTSGLRAEMGPGFARMNPITVQIAAKCIAQVLNERLSQVPGANRVVVVGHDHRHNSRRFAQISYRQLKRCGLHPLLFAEPIPTPLLAFAIGHFKAAGGGIMVTASHNPKTDNGYKVYGQRGCQIVSPDDKAIARLIDAFDGDLDDLSPSDSDHVLTPVDELFSAYARKMLDCMADYKRAGNADGKIVYTPVHGVGQKFVAKLVEFAGLPELVPVEQQMLPDPDFPTVKSPNPEEGASVLRLAIEKAEQCGAHYVFANDPDVDRFNMAELGTDGEWRIFTGDEIAAMFVDYILASKENLDGCVLLSTTVSSRLIERQAAARGVLHRCTFTGFKHLGNLAWDLEHVHGKTVPFAFEEAIGFMVGGAGVYEKDGMSALLLAYHLVNWLQSGGRRLGDYLASIYEANGWCVQYNSYVRCPAHMTLQAFEKIRKRVGTVEGLHVAKDYAPSNMIDLGVGDDLRITLRASGTEPKIKFYSEVFARDPSALRATVRRVLSRLFENVIEFS